MSFFKLRVYQFWKILEVSSLTGWRLWDEKIVIWWVKVVLSTEGDILLRKMNNRNL